MAETIANESIQNVPNLAPEQPTALTSEQERRLAELETKESIETLPKIGQQTEEVSDSLEWGEVGLQAISNIPSSGKKFFTDIAGAFKNPKQTAKAFIDLTSGAAQLLVPGEQGNEDVARAFGDFVKDRYGSVDSFKNTIATDPVGFAADLSTFVTGLGGAAGVTGKVGQISKIAKIQKAADFIVEAGRKTRAVGAAVDPIGAVGAVAKARTPVNSLAKTALNIKADLPVRTVDRIAQNFMDRGLNITRESLKKLDAQNKKLNATIQDTISSSAKSGTPIKVDKILNVIDELKANAAREGLSATDLKTLDALADDFGLVKGQTLTPSQAQDLKVGFNKAYSESLTDQFGAIRSKFFDKARIGTKTELERIWPELKGINLEEGAGIELSGLINKAINNFEKSPSIRNLGLATGGVGGAVIGSGTGAIEGLGFAATAVIVGNILANPRTGIRIAKILSSARKSAANASTVTRPAFQAGRFEEELKQRKPRGSKSTLLQSLGRKPKGKK